jgi:hypothetical protein
MTAQPKAIVLAVEDDAIQRWSAVSMVEANPAPEISSSQRIT